MAFILIHSFVTVDNVVWEVQYDVDTDIVQAFSTPDSPFSIVSEAELGLSEGYIIQSHCKPGTYTRVKVVAQTAHPFAAVVYEYNSPECSPQNPCTIEITDIAITHESAAGLKDGQLLVTAVQGNGAYATEYSLDNLNWQSENLFYGLMPGRYVVYVRASTIFTNEKCYGSQRVTINPGQAVDEIDYPWEERLCKFFRLIRDGVTSDIREPIKWDNITFIGKRDREWHGFKGMFSDGIIELEFDCESGKEVIMEAYETDGSDAEVAFQYGYTYNGKEVILFPGKLNFNTYKELVGKVALSVDKDDFNSLFQSRFESKVSMASMQGFDGAFILPPPVLEIPLHAKEFIRNYKVESSAVITATQAQTQNQKLWLRPDTSVPAISEIETNFGFPLSFSVSEPGATDEYNWDLQNAGTYSFGIKYNHTLTLRFWNLHTIASRNYGYKIRSIFRVDNNEQVIGAAIEGSGSLDRGQARSIVIPLAVDGSFTMDLIPGQKVYFYSYIEWSGGSNIIMRGSTTENSSLITAVALDRAPVSVCATWFLFDVLNHCTKVITNNRTRILSSFLSRKSGTQAQNGEGALNAITNGKQIRRFEVEKAPLNISLRDALSSAKDIFCLGYGFEQVGNVEVVRVERPEYFYQNREIIVIEELVKDSYRKEVAKDLLYNEIDIGFDKFQDSGFNTLDEFNTRHEYVTPIKTNKLKLVAKSKLIASGYAIESSRRQQFSETPTNSFQNDEEPFIISLAEDGINFKPETDQAFEQVEGLISPSTAYNLRLSPLRMLLNWSVWLRNSFHYKQPATVLKNTLTVQNGDLTTQYKATEPAPVGDINKMEWQEKQDISLSNYEVEERIFKPQYIYAKTRLTPDKVQLITDSMQGRSTDLTNYGYIVIKNPEGVYEGGWLDEIEYNHHTELCSFKMLEKWDSPVVPGAACCKYLVINGCYVLINGEKIIM